MRIIQLLFLLPIFLLGCATSNNQQQMSFAEGLNVATTAERQEQVIARFAVNASKGDLEQLIAQLWPSTRNSFGESKWRKYLTEKIIPYFSSYEKIDSYKGLSSTTLEDPLRTTAIVHFGYIRDNQNKRKPFEMVMVTTPEGTYVANLYIGRCVKGHHPVCE